jgi:exosome complex component RRP42
MISDITKKSIGEFLKEGKRLDGRKLDEFRKIEVETGVVEKAEGSAVVTLGDSKVIVGVKLGTGTPFSDRPDQGVLMTNAELTAFSNPEFEAGPPGPDAVEIARVIDRAIREADIIDIDKLCIKAGETVWMVFVDVYTLNANGNIFDAGCLAAMAALATAKMPEYKDGEVDYETRKKKLPMNGQVVSATFAKIGDQIVVDPTMDEEQASDCRITVGVKEGNIVSLQKGGEGGFTDKEIEEVFDRALKHSKNLLKALK